ncbi:MAG: ATP-binding protein, partial [Burkholderiaceae bacterium]|nr:ATP-binding protein [Burkholderiaceae bacterium]
AGLLRVMAQVHAARHLSMDVASIDPELAFAGESQDLQEMLGNVLDNACKWARHTVQVSAQRLALSDPPRFQITVEDDGPGIETSRRDAVMNRGARLDESVPGSGLGLAIVHELEGLYGGQVDLQDTALGGLRVVLTLPAADVRISPPAPAR